MEPTKLIAALRETKVLLDADNLSAIDFTQLQQLLEVAAKQLESLQLKAGDGERLLALFRDELANRARAIAKAQGKETHLALQLLAQPEMTLARLLELRRELDQEFDQVFSAKLTEPSTAAATTEEVQQFKI